MRHVPILAATVTAMFLAGAPEGAFAQDRAAPAGWRLYASAEGCSVSISRSGAFVLFNVNAEGQEGLRIHHPDLIIADRRPATVTLRSGDRALTIEAAGARTSDGTPGFIASGRSDLRAAFGAVAGVEVELPASLPVAVDLEGLPDALAQLDACAAGLSPRDPATIVAVKPRMVQAPAIRPGDLPLEGATRREVGWRLTISPQGKITACEIIRSSGSRALDDQVCRLLRASSRFEPGRNAAGDAVTATFQSRLTF